MTPPSQPSDSVAVTPPSLAERRQQLAVRCALDRAHLRLVLARPSKDTAAKSTNWVRPALQTALGLTRFLPGKIGRWSRRFGLVATILTRAL